MYPSGPNRLRSSGSDGPAAVDNLLSSAGIPPHNGEASPRLAPHVFNWNDLVFFLELARQNRLAPTARRLRVDHTTVSRRIAELEKDLSVKLFDRKKDGFVLTEQGHRLLATAERMEQEAGNVPALLGTGDASAIGRVRVATMEGIGAWFLTERLVELREQQPGLVVELVTERHLINLTKREADVFLSFVPPVGQRLTNQEGRLLSSRSLRERELHLQAWNAKGPKRARLAHVRGLRRGFGRNPTGSVAAGRPRSSVRCVQVDEHARATECDCGWPRHRAAAAVFSDEKTPDSFQCLPRRSEVYRDVYLSVHEDLEYLARIRLVTRHIADVFRRDARELQEMPPRTHEYD